MEFEAKTASVTTGTRDRDNHLRSSDFLDAEQFPIIGFKSTGIRPHGKHWKLTGDLTIREVTNPVTFALTFEGVATDPYGNTKAGFNASGEIERKDWGLTWNVPSRTVGFSCPRPSRSSSTSRLTSSPDVVSVPTDSPGDLPGFFVASPVNGPSRTSLAGIPSRLQRNHEEACNHLQLFKRKPGSRSAPESGSSGRKAAPAPVLDLVVPPGAPADDRQDRGHAPASPPVPADRRFR